MCKLNSVNVYPLANFIHVPAIKLFHPPGWCDPTGYLEVAAAGALVGTRCEDLKEY